MATFLANPERLFDRTWRPRHPLRPKLSAARRWGMTSFFLALCTIIFGYSWLTDSNRVRAMAGSYLSERLGGNVEIGRASLSIFEGLRLENVIVRVDSSHTPDSVLFSAQSFIIHYNPAQLLAGRLQATQIIAIEPKITLVEDIATHQWNYQRMLARLAKQPSEGPRHFPTLPEIILRDAQVRYLKVSKDGGVETAGWMTLEGRLSPSAEDDRYDFELQSRGREALGPSVEGMVWTQTGKCVTRWKNFQFGPDIISMLPDDVRAYCQEHDLHGRLDIPDLTYVPAHNGVKAKFRVEMMLEEVVLAIQPREWMSRVQNQHVEEFHRMLIAAAARRWLKPALAGSLLRLSSPEPIHLQDVSGTFVFTDDGIDVSGVNGRLENNWFNIDGSIHGYSADAPASLTISSLASHKLYMPPWSPTYAGSLPPEVQEVYERLRPEGWCSVWIKLDRPEAGARPKVAGEIEIQDGQFTLQDFPYPLRNAMGKIIIGYDQIRNMDGIRIINVRGRGPEGGPNANSYVALDGFIGPLDQVAGAWLDVHGENMSSEPRLRAALPRPVDLALRIFDPMGLGEYPKFHGSFTSHLYRPIGSHKRWDIQTDIMLDHVEGTLTAFPYPLKDLSCRLEVREGYLDIINGQMNHGDASVNINGRVTWKTNTSPPTTRPYGPDLTITAKNMPVDADLLAALPQGQSRWLARVGATGKIDVQGRLTPAEPPESDPRRDVDYAFDLHLHDGGLWPVNGVSAISGMNAALHVTPDKLDISQLTARRGNSNIQAHGEITWAGHQPRLALNATADNLALDAALYDILPAEGRQGWDAIQPKGAVDAALTYSCPLDDLNKTTMPAAPAATNPADVFELKLLPRGLAITPSPLPYRLDDLGGTVVVTRDNVKLTDMTARHGEAVISFGGEGKFGEHPSWDLQVGARDLSIDNEIINAVPESVATVLKAINTQGKCAVEFSKLSYRPQTVGGKSVPDIDFAGKITFAGAAMDIGLPVSDVFGTMDMAGLVRAGQLHRLMGQADIPKMMMAGRAATNFKWGMSKSSDDSVLQIQHVEGSLAGGGIAGDAQLSYPDAGPPRYDLSIVLRDADVQQLTNAPAEKNMRGRLTASLTMGGVWSDTKTRRGHGDVRVSGEDMYDIPIVLGLLQVTNLALPISSPFSEATTRYTIDGQRVVFERIDMKSKDMTMSGSGLLDFNTRQVDLQFVTDNPTIVNIPIVGPVIHLAKQELLRIHVNGSIQEPKVTASTFDSITTTVDRVFTSSDDKK